MTLRRCGPATRWNKVVPTKVRIHNWRYRLNRLPTKENLSKRGIIIGNENCILCSSQRETSEHLFGSCNKAVEVRMEVNKWWNLLPVSCDRADDIFGRGGGGTKDPTKVDVRDITGQAYTWAMWKGRNEAIFNNIVFNPRRTACLIQALVFHWISTRHRFGRTLNWADWCCNPTVSSFLRAN